MPLIQATIDKETKDAAEAIYRDMGINIPIAVRMFLKATIKAKGLPFKTSREETAKEPDNHKGEYLPTMPAPSFFHSGEDSLKKILENTKTQKLRPMGALLKDFAKGLTLQDAESLHEFLQEYRSS